MSTTAAIIIAIAVIVVLAAVSGRAQKYLMGLGEPQLRVALDGEPSFV